MKRIVTIQDISCLGKCSLTAALPVISAMGVETAVLPTAVLSTHTMFEGAVILNLEDQIEPVSRHWESLQFHFDAVYTGYLASHRQIDLVKDFFRRFGKEDTLRFVDPAMADYGKLYSGFDGTFPAAMASLCGEADIIVPNITEACLMTGAPYRTDPDEAYIRELLERLAALGTRRAVVLTGVTPDSGKTGVSCLDIREGRFFSLSQEKLPRSYHGTGDLFASVTLGALMRDFSLEEALRLAADFVGAAIAETIAHDPGKTYGTDFEAVIPFLTDAVRKGPGSR
ncbi:MAG: pyridoxamine kinase [Lachnospiraceae bacterium]|nr:pyridoxamine kinase [Lachnospiraceae bacterium]